MQIEYYYRENILLTGDIYQSDASFSHDFGIKRDSEIEVKNFKVFIDDGWDQYEMTREIEKKAPKKFEDYKNALVEYYEGRLFAEEAG